MRNGSVYVCVENTQYEKHSTKHTALDKHTVLNKTHSASQNTQC